MKTLVLGVFLLLPSAAHAIPDNIWTHIETACTSGQTPIKNSNDSWSCGTPQASSVPATGVTAGTFIAGVLVPAANIRGVIVSTALPTSVVYTTTSYVVFAGSASVPGVLHVGWETITASCPAAITCTASCSADKVVTGGGCAAYGTALSTNAAGGSTFWVCGSTGTTNLTAYSYCARFAP